MAKKTKSIGSMWNKARETTKKDTSDFVPVEPGSYVMQLVFGEIADFGKSRKLHTKMAVLDDGEDRGKICMDWDAIDDEERMVWVQRKLIAFGVDLDEVDIETEDDLLAVIQERIEECAVCRVKVTEKDGYTNMRVQKPVEWDEDDLFDPEEVLEGLEDEEEEDEEEGEEEGEEEEVAEKAKYKYSAGDMLIVEYDGDELEAEVLEGGDKAIKVRYTVDDEEEVIKASRIIRRAEEEEEEEVEEEDEEVEEEEVEEEEEEVEEEVALEKGNRVIVDIKGKEQAGIVVSVNNAKGTCRIKLDKNGKTQEFKQDEVDFEIDD